MNFIEKTTFNAIFEAQWVKYKKMCFKQGITPDIKLKEKLKNEALKNYEFLRYNRKNRKRKEFK